MKFEGTCVLLTEKGSPSPNNNNVKERDNVTGIFIKHPPLPHHLKPRLLNRSQSSNTGNGATRYLFIPDIVTST